MSNTRRDAIRIGAAVSVILKNDQNTGRLTGGIVQELLTNSAIHHRGIKVRLQDGQVGRVAQIHPGGLPSDTEQYTTSASAYSGRQYGHGGQDNDDDGPPRANTQLSDWFTDLDKRTQKNRSVPVPLPSEQHEQEEAWSCLGCTFQNNSALQSCEMCETPR